jgi:hypothetical protein
MDAPQLQSCGGGENSFGMTFQRGAALRAS